MLPSSQVRRVMSESGGRRGGLQVSLGTLMRMSAYSGGQTKTPACSVNQTKLPAYSGPRTQTSLSAFWDALQRIVPESGESWLAAPVIGRALRAIRTLATAF